MAKTYKLLFKFKESVLGTTSGNKELYSNFVASKAPDFATMEQEIADYGVEAVEEKGMTFFPRMDDGEPFFYDYQVKGYFKGTCGFLRNVPGSESSKIKAYKKKLDGLLFVYPRKIPLNMAGDMGVCQRPLRASTMQGERVALASSEEAPEGSTIECYVEVLDNSLEKFLFEALNNAKRTGIGQWRNSGKGRFTYTVLEEYDCEYYDIPGIE